MRYVIKIILFMVVIALFGCLMLYLGSRPTPSRKDLCADLSSYIEVTDCLEKRSVTEVLTAAFKPGAISRSEVNAAIGQYRYDIKGSFDYYKLDSTWMSRHLPVFETSYHFRFDESNLFIGFTVEE